jgi:SAM-dependent methyltransferase
MDLKEIDILGVDIDRHWYYRSKAKAMSSLLENTNPSIILDVGAGSGYFSRYLLDHTSAREAWCVDISYDCERDESLEGKQIHFRRATGASGADLVLLMDVLEHVDSDVSLLEQYVDKVASGSQFLITVPAFSFLWSGHDDFLEHKRRYTVTQLETVVRTAGLRVHQAVYYFGMVFPIAAILRMGEKIRSGHRPARSQLTRHHPVANWILELLCNAELPLMHINRVAGLTILCLATKS